MDRRLQLPCFRLEQRGDAPPLGIGVIVPHDVVDKARNVLRNNMEGRTAAIQAVFVRGA